MGVRQTVSNTNRTRFIQKLANIEEQIFLMKRKISNDLDFTYIQIDTKYSETIEDVVQ